MDAKIAARKAEEAAEDDRKEALEIARRDREYRETHRLERGTPILEELEAARRYVESLPPGRLRDCLLQLQRGSAMKVNAFRVS